jgi:simple sugar transport system ATP-binding protein
MGYVFEMINITKRFPGIVANDNITLQVERGEIHALLGENGAGKSTLMSVLFGLYNPEIGRILIDGKEQKINNPNDANRFKIGMVHQHFKLVHNFTALENIVLGVEPSNYGFLSLNKAREKLVKLTEHYGLKIDLDRIISDMTVGMQQRVEILKMLYKDNEILIFDEPTAVLTPQEIDELMQIMRNLVKEGKSIVFISHKLNEIMSVADRCTVLWKGKGVGTVNTADTTKELLSEMMVGRKVILVPEKGEQHLGETVMKVKNLCVKDKKGLKDVVKNVSFEVKKGEICCIAGIDGNGQTDLAMAISGLTDVESGEIIFLDENWEHKPVKYRINHGMGHIPEDRHKHGLVLDYSLAENCVLHSIEEERFHKLGFIKRKVVRDYAESLIKRFDIRTGQGAATLTRSMSGGNQQKIILAREIDRHPKLLIAVQPTRGLDIGAIEYIHSQLLALRDSGHAILLVSLEMEEVMNISDRILVMFNGEIVCDLGSEEATVQELGLYMAGLKGSDVK